MKRILTLIAALTILVFAAGCSLSGGTGTGQAGNEQQQQSKVTVVKFRNRIWRKNLRKVSVTFNQKRWLPRQGQ